MIANVRNYEIDVNPRDNVLYRKNYSEQNTATFNKMKTSNNKKLFSK